MKTPNLTRVRAMRRALAASLLVLSLSTLAHAQNMPLAQAQAGAAKGDAESEFQLGRAYDRGEGVPHDGAQAVKWYQAAAQQGNAKAMNNLGSMYEDGRGVPADPNQAIQWFQKGAQAGAALAQLNYAKHLEKQVGGGPQSVEWYKKAGQQGVAEAQRRLAQLYYFGDNGVPQDDTQSFAWATLAAKQGDAVGETILGTLYQQGRGVSKSPKDARLWLQKAADQGNAKAECNLGSTYLDSDFGEQDKVTAYLWLTLASRQNDILAIKLLHDLKLAMTHQQLDEGNRLVRLHARHQHPVFGVKP